MPNRSTMEVRLSADLRPFRSVLEAWTEAVEQFDAAIRRAQDRMTLLVKTALARPDEIKLYAWCRVKVDPKVPLAYQGQWFSLADRGFYCDVGLYEPIFVSVEEYWR